ncbi:amidase [Cecembia calidifontis]|uniref:Asp-tRNA(Asn)/Glu-tRNA(Gln) amidotransferase A subunit family amidase n=1 Tax=Cecembia calidifontis TaxID=1187080 RepID=A0A4Q7P6C8_9BACT|nr:amidase [Cecembia calidifontis]RZS95544.1 Asp-tRNA(Asn)/Glu-tRNA(Gln) amidotransferase A subunit family amidase [Cecembia calidifontis]
MMLFKNKSKLGLFVLGAGLLSIGFIAGKKAGEITPAAISGAETLIGLAFTPAEKDSMIQNLTNHRNSFERMREQKIENATSPALYFNPLPHGFIPSQEQRAFDWGLPAQVRLPEKENDIAFLSVAELSVLIKNKQISSERLTRIYLDRIKKYADTLECLITLMEEEAIVKAKKMDAELAAGKYRGPLHGIPYGIKDLLAVKGTKTTWGAMPYKDQVIDETATVVEKLEAAGGVLVGKFTLGALAMGDVWYGGVTKNPWNLQQGSSGSSAGSGSAVSAGLVPFAIGTETLGSIVSPSTRNGVTGLRPTFGRVSRHGAMALSWSMDKIGPMSRSALDNAIVLSVINGFDPKDKSTIAAAFNYNAKKSFKDLKVGYFAPFFEGERATDQDRRVVEELKAMGVELHPLELKTSVDVPSMLISLYVEGAAAFDELTRLDLDDLLVAQHRNAWPNLFRSSRFIPAVEYIQANRFRNILIEEMHALFSDYDVIVTPSYGGNQLQVTNLTGHPALCMPNGFNSNGSPVSITFLANLFDEEKLIILGRAYQEHTEWQKKRPPLFDQ